MSIAMKKCFPSPASICDIGEKPGELIGDTEDGGIDYTLFDWFSAQWTHSHSLFISVLDFWVHYSPAVVSVMYRMLSSYPYPENQERIAPSSCVGEKASQFLSNLLFMAIEDPVPSLDKFFLFFLSWPRPHIQYNVRALRVLLDLALSSFNLNH